MPTRAARSKTTSSIVLSGSNEPERDDNDVNDDNHNKRLDRVNNDIAKINAYPVAHVLKSGNERAIDALKSAICDKKDKRPFFTHDMQCRICTIPEEYMTPACHDSEVSSALVHRHSFSPRLKSVEAALEKLDDATKDSLQSLCTRRTLQLDGDLPATEIMSDGNSKKKKPIVVVDGEYAPSETVLRYLPALVAEEKNILMGGNKFLTDALFTRLLYDIDPKNLPERNSEEAKDMWSEKVKDKLFVVGNEPISKASSVEMRPTKQSDGAEIEQYALYYTIRIPEVMTPMGNKCQGFRRAIQARKALVQHWVELTTKLVGSEKVPAVVSNYLNNRFLHGTSFDSEGLLPKAQDEFRNGSMLLYDAGSATTNEKGRVTLPELDENRMVETAKTWKDNVFVNPSIDFRSTDNDGTRTELILNSTESQKAGLGLLFSRVGYHDGSVYRADEYNTNLKKMAVVYKAIAFAILDKDPYGITPYDEVANAAKRASRKRKTSAHEQEGGLGDDLRETLDGIVSTLNAINEKIEEIDNLKKMIDDHVGKYSNEVEENAKRQKVISNQVKKLEKLIGK